VSIKQISSLCSRYSNPLDDKRSVRLLKQLMPLVSDERDKHEVKKKKKLLIKQIDFGFTF
jgi:hypothetical protein